MRIYLLTAVLMLAVCNLAAGRNAAPVPSPLKIKWVKLDDKYTIQVPEYLTPHRIADRATSVPSYWFDAVPPPRSTIQVFVLPYSVVIPLDENTGLFKLPIGINGSGPLTAYFKIRENLYAYYGLSVVDEAYECTMNSPCPHPTQRGPRYTTWYTFAVFDKPNGSIVEFMGSFASASKMTEFRGDGKLLRDVIVPSLTSFHVTPE